MLPGKFARQHFLLSVAEVSGLRSTKRNGYNNVYTLLAAEARDLRYGYNIAELFCY